MVDHRSVSITVEEIGYSIEPAARASELSEVVNWVERHDSQTLFDGNAHKRPSKRGRRTRLQVSTCSAGGVVRIARPQRLR